MSIVKYSEAPANPHQLASQVGGKGAVRNIDLESGHVFDADGNTVGKWTPIDGSAAVQEKNSMLAQYASQQYMATWASSLASAQFTEDARERGKQMLDNAIAQNGDELGHMSLLDLGTSDVHIPSANPNIAMGYKNEAPMADVYSPVVMVPKAADYYFAFDKNDAFQRALPTLGVGAGNVSEIAPRLGSTLYTTVERALGGFVSTQLEAAADAPLRILQATTKRVLNAMILEREIRVQSLARTTGNWNSNNFATILAANKWNGGTGADPLADINGRQEASVMDVSGIIMALPTWNAFVRNPAIRAFYAFKDRTRAVPTPQELSTNFGLPPIYVSKMKYVKSDGTVQYIWGGDVVLFRAPDEQPPTTQDDIASSYSFRWNLAGKPTDASQASGGFIVRQFFSQERGSLGGLRIIIVHQDAEVQTSGIVGGLLVNAFV